MPQRIGMMLGALVVLAGLHAIAEALGAFRLIDFACQGRHCIGRLGLFFGPLIIAVGIAIMRMSWRGEDLG